MQGSVARALRGEGVIEVVDDGAAARARALRRRVRTMRALAALALVAVYVVALGPHGGRHLDAVAIETDVGTGAVVSALHRLLYPITWLTIGTASLTLVLWALRRHGVGCARRIAVGIIGTYGSLVVLGALFYHVDPLGGETFRRLGRSSYPSGHAAAVAAVALAAVALAPRRARPLAAVVACVVVATVGVALVVIHAHYPSDVLGGWLLSLMWGAGAASSCRGP